MSQTLKAKPEDLPIVSDYIHDSYIDIESFNYDSNEKVFSFIITRICYEKWKKGRFLFLIPVVKYPKIDSQLSINKFL
jgi:hypothetical protein